MSTPKKFLLGVFDNEHHMKEAAVEIKKSGVKIFDIFTPFPLHGLDELLDIKRTRLPYVTFLAGLTGATFAICFQTWTHSFSWPLKIGGKPYFSLPAYIPITFELTVLFGAFISVFAFLFRSRLFPRPEFKNIHPRVTNDQFVIALEQTAQLNEEKMRTILKSHHAVEVKTTDYEVCS